MSDVATSVLQFSHIEHKVSASATYKNIHTVFELRAPFSESGGLEQNYF
jgi:hypothetical protein